MRISRIIIVIIGLMVLLPNYAFSNNNYKVIMNDQLASFQEPVFVEKGRLYVPVRFVGEQLGAAVEWNGAKRTVSIQSPIHDQLTFFADSRKVTVNNSEYLMDVSPIIRYERLYLPIRHVAELLHLKVTWENQNNIVHLDSVPLYEVQTGDSLYSISQQFDTTEQLIKDRNNLESNTIHPNTNLKVVIPYVMKNQSEDDIQLLAKLIEVEAGTEPFIGQVAIGNVILNRVEDGRFPNTIDSVILEAGQFTPVSTGKINKVEPTQSSLDAAKKALQGEKPVKDAVYFFNRSNTKNAFLLAREVVMDIGNHRFTK